MGSPSPHAPFDPRAVLEPEPSEQDEDDEEQHGMPGLEDAGDAFELTGDVVETAFEAAPEGWSCGLLDFGCFDVADCGSLDCGGLDCGF